MKNISRERLGGEGALLCLLSAVNHTPGKRIKRADPKTGKSPKSLTTPLSISNINVKGRILKKHNNTFCELCSALLIERVAILQQSVVDTRGPVDRNEWENSIILPPPTPPSLPPCPPVSLAWSDNGQVTVIPETSPSPPPDYCTLSQTLAHH